MAEKLTASEAIPQKAKACGFISRLKWLDNLYTTRLLHVIIPIVININSIVSPKLN